MQTQPTCSIWQPQTANIILLQTILSFQQISFLSQQNGGLLHLTVSHSILFRHFPFCPDNELTSRIHWLGSIAILIPRTAPSMLAQKTMRMKSIDLTIKVSAGLWLVYSLWNPAATCRSLSHVVFHVMWQVLLWRWTLKSKILAVLIYISSLSATTLRQPHWSLGMVMRSNSPLYLNTFCICWLVRLIFSPLTLLSENFNLWITSSCILSPCSREWLTKSRQKWRSPGNIQSQCDPLHS